MISKSSEGFTAEGLRLAKQTVPLTPDQMVCIQLINTSQHPLVLPRFSIVGRAVLLNPEDRTDDSPGYLLQLLRRYLTPGTKDISIKGRYLGSTDT